MNAGSPRVSALHDAVDAWLEAKQALERAMPWTAEWLRLRMLEQDRRAAYLALVDGQAAGADNEIRVEPSRLAEAMDRPTDGPPGGIRTPDLLIRSQSL